MVVTKASNLTRPLKSRKNFAIKKLFILKRSDCGSLSNHYIASDIADFRNNVVLLMFQSMSENFYDLLYDNFNDSSGLLLEFDISPV